MTRTEVVTRARTAVGLGTRYELGKGGFTPTKPSPGLACDCSGFIAWALGVKRKTVNPYYIKQNGGWFETTAVYRDAQSPFGFVSQVDLIRARPGDIVVWPDKDGHQGHIGLVSVYDPLNEVPQKVIHCSMSNWHHVNDAIQETDIDMFLEHHAIFAKVAWIEDDA